VTATFSQMAFARTLGADFPLLSDWEREVCAAYGVRYDVWKDHSGLAKRSIFVIDADRRIRWSWCSEDALILPALDDMVEAIASTVGRPVPPGPVA
jgi:glutaredoxin-dependent peroxiredoxin